MKCIGGPLDGVRYEPRDKYEYQQAHAVKVRFFNEINSIKDFFNVDKIPEMITEKYFIYTVRLMEYNTNETKNKRVDIRKLWYLAPPDWSDWDAIEFQMRK